MTGSATQPPRDTLVHVADLHFWHVTYNVLRLLNKRALGNFNVWWKRRRQFAMDHAIPFVEALDAAGPRTVLLTGDFTSTSLDEEFARAREFVAALRKKDLDVCLIPGNHDVYTFESVRKKRFEKYFADFIAHDGLPARVTLPGGTPLLVAPTVCPNWVSSRGRITDAEAARVGDLLAGATEPLLVAGHYPLLDKTAAYEITPERRLRNASALRAALGESGKKILYVAGHVHRFSLVRDPEYSNLAHLCTGTFFGVNTREKIDGEFSEIAVHGDSFAVTRHVHGDTWRNCPVEFV